jgi:hypothetical protein
MAKKAPKRIAKVRRTRSIEMCIEDAQDFIREKRITKTKTMVRTIAEAKRILAPLKNGPAPKRAVVPKPKKATRKRAALSVRAARPSLPALPAAFGLLGAHTPHLFGSPVPPLGSSAPLFGVSSGGVDSKKTIFKKSTMTNLPLPTFGFIDICFCLDATGSMTSELAQVKSTIEALIHKI